MRKLFAVLAVFAFVFAFSFGAQAQTLTTDIVFLKLGYIPLSNTNYKDYSEDLESRGLAIQGEYNLNFDGFLLGFGLEYQRLKTEWDGELGHINQFIQPMISAKYAALGGLYVGAGLSGKYLIATEEMRGSGGAEWQKKFDLWINGIMGYYMPIGEGVFLDLEGRFGYNLTKNQFTKVKGSSGEYKLNSSYDLAFYVGVGFRTAASDY
ncbi:MAG: hypothetical protein QM472_09280 [Spirochaetota bacterium]|nr:hypothetical protein [Spirochaetota bacterium]